MFYTAKIRTRKNPPISIRKNPCNPWSNKKRPQGRTHAAYRIYINRNPIYSARPALHPSQESPHTPPTAANSPRISSGIPTAPPSQRSKHNLFRTVSCPILSHIFGTIASTIFRNFHPLLFRKPNPTPRHFCRGFYFTTEYTEAGEPLLKTTEMISVCSVWRLSAAFLCLSVVKNLPLPKNVLHDLHVLHG